MTQRPLKLTATDGFTLGANLFEPEGAPAKATVVMAGATGVSQRFYRRFAEALTADGFAVVTLDYRGIGESRPNTLRGFECRYEHWARRDLPAAVDFALSRGPALMVGHSFGGHAFGQLPNPNALLGLYTVATGAAWSGYMPPLERLKVETLWNVAGPLVVPWVGYAPGRLWGGESLPLGVYRDWDRWCHMRNYFFDDPRESMQAMFDRVTVTLHAAVAEDDAWAPPASQRVFISHYRNARLTMETHTCRELGAPSVGHMGHFRASVLPAFVPRVLTFANGLVGAAAGASSQRMSA